MIPQKNLLANSVRQISILLLILLALFLAACDAKQNDLLTDRSFITSQPCAAPCWYGLEPDKSSREDVYATLHRLPFVDQTSINEYITMGPNDEQDINAGWSCSHPKNDTCGGSAHFSANKLESLYLTPGYILTFSDTVKIYGPPGYVEYFPRMDPKCGLSLVWPAQGILISSQLPKRCPSLDEVETGLLINPNIQVSEIYFESPDILQDRIARSSDGYQPWSGFSMDTFSFLDFVPGSLDMWLFMLLTLVLLVVISLWKRRWPSPVFSFVLAALAMIGPTVQFQFSDVITPMCSAYLVNVLLCGAVYYLIAEAARRVWAQRAGATAAAKDTGESAT